MCPERSFVLVSIGESTTSERKTHPACVRGVTLVETLQGDICGSSQSGADKCKCKCEIREGGHDRFVSVEGRGVDWKSWPHSGEEVERLKRGM